MNNISKHYDLLIENGNDPVLDSEELSKYMDKWDGEQFISLLNLDKNKTVLEIGCGTGRIAKKIIDNCKAYVGVDISSKTIDVARMHFSKNENANFICVDFLTGDFSCSFDVIYSTLTFMHIKDKTKALNKIFSLLNSGGRLVLSLDKNQQEFIDTGYSKIKVFPDNPKDIRHTLENLGYRNITVKEIDLAHLITAEKY